MWSPIPKNISTSPDAGPVKVDMMVGPKQFERITGFLNCSNVAYSITLANVQRAIGLEDDVEDEDGDEDGDGVNDDVLRVSQSKQEPSLTKDW